MADLNGVRLPDNSRFLRQIPQDKLDDQEFIAAFDRHTLFYDVFFDESSGDINIIAPSLKTQRRLIKQAVIKVNGHRVEGLRVELISSRTSQIRFPSPVDAPDTLRISHRAPPKLNAQVKIGRSNTAKFSGRNALVAISKNNKLSWIKEWLEYYVKVHSADAVALIDNGSDQYALRDLRQTMLSVNGIEAAEILSAPYPFGPKATDLKSVKSKFLHLSALHIAHRRYLSQANAVLSVDIDELVTKPGQQTVFEAAKAAREGFLSINGSWRYAARPTDANHAVRHADHVLKRIDEDAPMQPKWCVDPTGPLAGRYWRTHGILGARRNYSHEFRYLHCRQITTNWDYDRDFEPVDQFEVAPEAEALGEAFRPVKKLPA